MVRLAEAHGDVVMQGQPQLPTWAQVITGEGRAGASRYYRQGQYDYDLLQIRNLTLEDSFAERLVDALVLHSVRGSGVQVDFGVDRANRRFAEDWGWNSKKPADRKLDLERQIVRGFTRDGEDFRLWRFGAGQLFMDWVNPSRIPRDSGIWQGRQQGGIHFDEHWRPAQYDITAPSAEGYYASLPDMKAPAWMMVHTYRQDFDDQVRGVSWLRPCLRALQELTQYTSNVAEALDTMVQMPSYILLSDDFDEVEIGGEKSGDLLKRSLQVGPKKRFALPPGAKLETIDTPQMLTGTQIQDVVRFYAGRSARGTGVGSQILSTSTGQANMSEIRAEEAQDELVYQRAQHLLMGAMDSIARHWADTETMLDPSLRISPREVRLALPHPSYVDYRDRQAELKEIDDNVRSRSSAMRGRGDDPDEVWAEMEADARRIARLKRIEQGGDDAASV